MGGTTYTQLPRYRPPKIQRIPPKDESRPKMAQMLEADVVGVALHPDCPAMFMTELNMIVELSKLLEQKATLDAESLRTLPLVRKLSRCTPTSSSSTKS